jgi:hypothetical protein
VTHLAGQCYYIKGDSGGKVIILGGDSIGHCEKNSSYEHVSNSEWLPRQSCLNLARTVFPSLFSPDVTPMEFCLLSWMKSEVYKRRVDTREALHARILDAAACTKKREDQLRRTTRDLHK